MLMRVQVDEEDEDGQIVPFKAQEHASDSRQRPYRLWYTIEVQASAPPPERTLEVTCAAYSVVAVDMAVTNPTRERIVMDVLIEAVVLSGEPTIILHPRQQVTYHVTFSPTVIGEHTGRYELIFQDAESQSCLERSLGVSLLRKMKNQVSGVVILLFNFVFSPFKPFSHKTQLMITAASGGVWRFSIRVLATEPEVDDVITIESVGLNKESVVGFRMNSQMRHTLPFEAFFAPSSDPNFTITPAYGELPPSGTEGTLIKVACKPQIYGKTHKAKLVVQTSDMQWTYDILGTTADYNPPNVQARITSTSANSARRTVKQKKNYVLENLKLQSTAVSSPYKGVRLVSRSAR